MSASSFLSQINKMPIYGNFMTTVTRLFYDASNNTISSAVGAARIDYVLSIYKHRGTSMGAVPSIVSKDFDGIFQMNKGVNHSDINSGTFTLNIGGVSILVNNSTNIPYNVSPGTLQSALRASTIVGFDYVEVDLFNPVSCDYACTWIISYKGFKAQVFPYIQVISSIMGNSPTLAASTRRYYSPNIVFDPVDYRFLNTQAASVNVLVKTNGIPSICNGTCAYTFDTFSEISSLSLSGSKITLALSDIKNKVFTHNDVTVQANGNPCAIDPASSITSLSCYVQNNTDTTPLLVAGTFTPLVTIKNIGIVALASGVSPLTVPLTILTLSVTSGGTNGGTLTSINGNGFPLEKNLINITVCSKLATIKSVNNIDVQFYVPSCATTGS